MVKIILLTHLIILYNNFNHFSKSIAEMLKLRSNKTIADWTKKLREVAVQSCLLISLPIEGVGTVVEIDESQFGKSNFYYN